MIIANPHFTQLPLVVIWKNVKHFFNDLNDKLIYHSCFLFQRANEHSSSGLAALADYESEEEVEEDTLNQFIKDLDGIFSGIVKEVIRRVEYAKFFNYRYQETSNSSSDTDSLSDKEIRQIEADTSLKTSLEPYIDLEFDRPEMREAALALVEKDPFFPSFTTLAFVTPLMKTELNRVPYSEKLSIERYQLRPLPVLTSAKSYIVTATELLSLLDMRALCSSKTMSKSFKFANWYDFQMTDVTAWNDCVENSFAQIEDQKVRIVNLELMQDYGSEAWKIYFEKLQELFSDLQNSLEELKKEIQVENWSRKNKEKQKNLETQWVGLVSKNYEIEQAIIQLELENLVKLHNNTQWHELIKTCQKEGSLKDKFNITESLKVFVKSDFWNPSVPDFWNRSVPLFISSFIFKHGDLEMFKTFIKLSKFDLNGNQPIVTRKLIPYVTVNGNFTIALYLISKLDIEFRMSLHEMCLVQHSLKSLLPVFPPLLPYNLVRLKSFFSEDRNYVISRNIMSYLNMQDMSSCKLVTKSFKSTIESEIKLLRNIYQRQTRVLYEKLETIIRKAVFWRHQFRYHIGYLAYSIKEYYTRVLGLIHDISEILFFANQWKHITTVVDNLNNLDLCRILSRRLKQLNNWGVPKPPSKGTTELQIRKEDIIKVSDVKIENVGVWNRLVQIRKWTQDQRKHLISPVEFCLKKNDFELFKIILPHINIPATQFYHMNVLKQVVRSGKVEFLKILAPYVKLNSVFEEGLNSLHISAKYGFVSIFKYLLENLKIEDINLLNKSDQTPYDVATEEIKECFHDEFIKGILRKGPPT